MTRPRTSSSAADPSSPRFVRGRSAGVRSVAADRRRVRAVWAILFFLLLVVLGFVVRRVLTDGPNVTSGTVPGQGSFDRRFALHPVLAYVHILSGVVYLVGAPFQLNRRFRERHFALHKRMGRILVPAGIMAGMFAIVFGSLYAFDGLLEASATVVFGAYFIVALCIAFLAIRQGDAAKHRRWMIRAFAIGLAVGTIRIWVGVFQALGLLSFQNSFGVAFWLGFILHALAAEAYLAMRPSYAGARTPATPPESSSATSPG